MDFGSGRLFSRIAENFGEGWRDGAGAAAQLFRSGKRRGSCPGPNCGRTFSQNKPVWILALEGYFPELLKILEKDGATEQVRRHNYIASDKCTWLPNEICVVFGEKPIAKLVTQIRECCRIRRAISGKLV